VPLKPTIRNGKEIPSPGDWEVGDPTAQAEALPPDVLLAAIREAVTEHVNSEVLAQTLEDEKAQRDDLMELLGDG